MTLSALARASVFAHQGGWDEMLMVAGPIFLFWLILNKANKRAAKLSAPAPHDATPEDAAPEPSAALDVDPDRP